MNLGYTLMLSGLETSVSVFLGAPDFGEKILVNLVCLSLIHFSYINMYLRRYRYCH